MFVCFVTVDQVCAHKMFMGECVVRVESFMRGEWENACLLECDLVTEDGALSCNVLSAEQVDELIQFVYDELNKRAGDVPVTTLVVSWPNGKSL